MDAVFAGMDRLRAMLDDIQASDRVPCAQEMARFKAILEGQGLDQGAQVKARGKDAEGRRREFDLDMESVKSALAHGMNLFHATAYLRRDIKDKDITPLAFLNNALSVGQCLDAYIDLTEVADLETCLEQDIPVTILFGSVLESDLAAMALGLPPGAGGHAGHEGPAQAAQGGAPKPAAPRPRPNPSPEAAPPRRTSRPRPCRGGRKPAARAARERGQRPGDPAGPGGPADRADEPGRRAGAEPEPAAAGPGRPQQGHPGPGRHPAEHQPGDLRTAGRHHADPDAAHRHGVQPVPADHPGHGPAAGQADRDRDQGRRGGAGQVHRRAAHRPAHPHHPQLRRPRHRDAGRAQAS